MRCRIADRPCPRRAARKAAVSAMLRMWPPASLNLRARNAGPRPRRAARAGAATAARSRSRSASSGIGNSTTQSQPPQEGLVDVACAGWWSGRPGPRSLHAAAAGRRSRCWRSGRARRGPRSACRRARRPRRRAARRRPGRPRAKIRSRFFSVSPMYLLTTADRSIRYSSSPSSPAMISAAIVLPVPGGPANRAVSPARRACLRPVAPALEDQLAVPHAAAQLAQLGLPVGRQHDVGPGVAGLDLAWRGRRAAARPRRARRRAGPRPQLVGAAQDGPAGRAGGDRRIASVSTSR